MRLSSEKLFVAMAREQVTIAELAKRSNLSRKTISRQISGSTTTRPDIIGAISKALKTQVEELLEDEPGVAAPVN